MSGNLEMKFTESDLRLFLTRKPFIFVVGLEKCGTTSLNDYLALSETISRPIPKELEYFTRHFSKGIDWYLSHYDLSRKILVDCTPTYHWQPATLVRINTSSSRNAIVIMLRNPVERSYSAYIHRLNWFFESAFKNNNFSEYNYTFREIAEKGLAFVFPSFISVIERVSSAFPKSAPLTIPLEDFAIRPIEYVSKIEESLSTSITLPSAAVVPRSNSLSIPQFYRGHEIIERDRRCEKLIDDPKSVYICRGGMPRKVAEGHSFSNLKALESKWLQAVDDETCKIVYRKYYEMEISRLEGRLGINLDKWRTFQIPKARTVEPLSDDLETRSVEATLWLEQERFNTGNEHDAINTIRLAIAKEPGVVAYRRLLATMLMRIGSVSEAKRLAKEILTIAPANIDNYAFLLKISNRVSAADFISVDIGGSER